MKYLTDDVRITGMEEVTAPEQLLSEIPISDRASEIIFNNRREISSLLHGRDPRLLVIIGPCSIHDPKAALEYADRLSATAHEHAETLQIIMRVYFEKPAPSTSIPSLRNILVTSSAGEPSARAPPKVRCTDS